MTTTTNEEETERLRAAELGLNDIRTKMAATRNSVVEADNEIRAVEETRRGATRNLYEEIARIAQPFNDQEEALTIRKRELYTKEDELRLKERETFANVLALRIQAGQVTTQNVGDLVQALYIIKPDTISQKKPLANGVRIFNLKEEYAGSLWLAYYDGKCIGYSTRREGRHRGDSTYPYSYMSDQPYTKMGRKESVTGYDGKKGFRSYPYTYTDWSKHIAALTEEQLKALPTLNLREHVKTINKEGGFR